MSTGRPETIERFLVTGESVDPHFGDPVIEVNEERNDPEPHRYVHGSFKGTKGEFSFYFPAQARYQGRFFQNTYPLVVNADAGPSPIDFRINEGNIGFAFASGGYFVQTNQGAGAIMTETDPTLSSCYRLNAAAAKFSRVVAAEVYGKRPRPYGYIHGGSGGSLQVMGCAENTSGVWDGFLPYVLGTPYALCFMTNVVAHAHRVLSRRNKFPEILDALNPGGSGDPYATLNEEERAALREATLSGFPLRGWWQYQMIARSSIGSADHFDPAYTDDFWSKPGYLGTDPKSSIREARVQFETTISKVTAGSPATIELASAPDRDFSGSQFVMVSGASAGKPLPVFRVIGKTLTLGICAGIAGLPGAFLPAAVPDVQPGDKVRIDNSASLAFQTYYRHFLAPPECYAWNQFRDSDGKPLYPQRPIPVTPAISPIGSALDGHIKGKVLVMESMMDIHAWPWQADWYRSKVKEALGAKAGEDNFVLWFIDNAQHDVPGHFGTQGYEKQAWARTIDPVGALQQGLRDLAAWCEKSIRPAETHYKVVETQIQVPASAHERGGIQPTVTLQVNGGIPANVKANTPVKFAGTIEVPPKAGEVVAIAWDYEGKGDHPTAAPISTPQAKVNVSGEYTYTKPGTYFAVLRAFAQRQGDAQTPYAQVQNLARVRVVVS